MAESRVKIKATVNEINKHFNENPSQYFYIKHFNGEKYYTGDDDKAIVFETLIRHNEIGNRNIERSSPYTLQSIEKTLKDKVEEYEKENKQNKKSRIRVISGKCIGGYNDTMVYEINIKYEGKEKEVQINCSFDHSFEKNIWYVVSENSDISIKERYNIVDIISSNPPSIYSDTEPKIYNKDIKIDVENPKFQEIASIEEQFSKISTLKENNNIYMSIKKCATILNDIDIENRLKKNKEQKILYPEWATKENINLIKKWCVLQRIIEYENISQELQKDNYEEIITPLANLDDNGSFTVARYVKDNKCTELHYADGKAYLEYGEKVADDEWTNEIKEDVEWFNLGLTNYELLEHLNKEYDEHFYEIENDIDYDY